MKKQKFFCSFSGGKDSCFALYRALQKGDCPEQLLTMFNEEGNRSRSHGIGAELVESQAESLDIPLTIASASWQNYEDVFVQHLREFREMGIEVGVFGDIDLPEHREWCVRVCQEAGMKAHHPLWGRDREDVLEEFVEVGFESVVVAVKNELLGEDYLGRTFDHQLIDELKSEGVDPCGEKGELHTLVVDGPLFNHPLDVTVGNIKRDGDHSFCEIDLS